MKKICKRLLAVVLTVLMLLPVASQFVQAATIVDLPIVYVLGKYNPVYNKDETQVLYPLDPPIADTVKDNARSLYAAYQLAHQTNSDAAWESFANKIYDTVAPRYEAVMMDGNGNPQNGTHTKPNELPKTKKSGFWLHDYQFAYDSRLDPYENARLLNNYINNVMAVTGKSQVNLIGRCLGSTVVATYLTEYGCSKIKTCIFFAPAFNGVYMMDGFFTSDFKLDYARIKTYLKQGVSDGVDTFGGLRDIIDTADKGGLAGWGISSADDALQKSAKYLFPRLTLAIFGTWPGHWAMISKEAFQKAKATTLSDTVKYAGLIKKVERYQNNVMAKFPQTLENCRQQGMHVAIFCKYNTPMIPLSPDSSMQADGTVQLKTMSLGATAADINQMLTNTYMQDIKDETMSSFVEKQKQSGIKIIPDKNTNTGAIKRSNYLSDDNVIDASTCQYPDYTWFIRNCPHASYPQPINQLFLTIFRSPTQYTITTNKDFPQFIKFTYEKDDDGNYIYNAEGKKIDKIVPVTNADRTPEPDPDPVPIPWFERLAKKLTDFFQKIMLFFGIGR